MAKPERQKQDIPNELLGGLVERVTFHNEGSGFKRRWLWLLGMDPGNGGGQSCGRGRSSLGRVRRMVAKDWKRTFIIHDHNCRI
ncbi:hypothetical protein ANFP_21650 [Acidithiobacillus ferrooxidans]|nr:hypothetical protein ANFP_21650 [Acidithiobacillus ferrooxidans]